MIVKCETDQWAKMSKVKHRVPTVGSQVRKSEDFQVMVYRKPQKKAKENDKTNVQNDTKNANEFNIKKAMNEAIKFGISGFYQRKRERTMASLAIELGAKPEKKKYKNYKELQTLRKQQKCKREERLKNVEMINKFKRYNRKKTEKDRKKFQVNILNPYGKSKRN